MNKMKIIAALLALTVSFSLNACSDVNSAESESMKNDSISVQSEADIITTAETSQPEQLTSNSQTAVESADNTESEKEVTQLVVTINGKEFTATLEDTQAAKELTEMLPLTLTMSEMNGNEKYGDLPTGLTQDVYAPGEIHAGDILLWGSDTLVLFYESFSSSYSYTAVGYLDDPSGIKDAVGSGNAEVTISY